MEYPWEPLSRGIFMIKEQYSAKTVIMAIFLNVCSNEV
jgi:hypothetical protein